MDDPAPTDHEASEPLPGEQRTRLSGAWTAIVVGLIGLVVILVFILQNQQSVEVTFLVFKGHLPLAVALLFALILGAVVVFAFGAARILQLRMVAGRARGRSQAPVRLPSDCCQETGAAAHGKEQRGEGSGSAGRGSERSRNHRYESHRADRRAGGCGRPGGRPRGHRSGRGGGRASRSGRVRPAALQSHQRPAPHQDERPLCQRPLGPGRGPRVGGGRNRPGHPWRPQGPAGRRGHGGSITGGDLHRPGPGQAAVPPRAPLCQSRSAWSGSGRPTTPFHPATPPHPSRPPLRSPSSIRGRLPWPMRWRPGSACPGSTLACTFPATQPSAG